MKLTRFRPRLVQELRNYSTEKFTADLGAGITVGLVALPPAIAFGIASGVKPENGIFTAIIAGGAHPRPGNRCRLLISKRLRIHGQVQGPSTANPCASAPMS